MYHLPSAITTLRLALNQENLIKKSFVIEEPPKKFNLFFLHKTNKTTDHGITFHRNITEEIFWSPVICTLEQKKKEG